MLSLISFISNLSVYIVYQFISNNDALFHFWWKENLLNHQKVWKYYKYDCRSWHAHKYSKRKKCLSIMMLICTKQRLSNIWISIKKLSNTEAVLKKTVAYKNSV